MARTSWFNDNENRAYPFITGTADWLPQAAIVDFGCLMGPGSGFVEGQHNVWLRHVSLTDGDLQLTFACDAPGLADHVLRFDIPGSASRYAAQFAEAVPDYPGSISDELSGCVGDLPWSGYVVVGRVSVLLAAMAESSERALTAVIEPALIRNLNEGYVRTINLANADRTRATAPDGCRPLCWDYDIGGLFVRDTCLTGPIRFEPGYSCKITEDVSANAIVIGAVDPNGSEPAVAGPACEEVPLFDGETPPQGRTRLHGGLGCEEVFRSINGVGGRQISITGGNGVDVTFDPERHTIIVDVNRHALAVCQEMPNDGPPWADEDCVFEDPTPGPCDCGAEEA